MYTFSSVGEARASLTRDTKAKYTILKICKKY